ncbi:MAG: YciI family protein [Ramlibacter sp.]
MRFMIIVKATADSEAGRFPDNPEPLFNAMAAYHEELAKAGVLLDGSGLQPSSKGWRVQYDAGGKRTIVDGPFTESKELVAGYTLIQTRTRDEAIEWSRRFPNPIGEGVPCHVEVRQLYEMEDFDGLLKAETSERFRSIGTD